MAWWHSFGLPVVMTNCSNNYGPFQFPEKLIPLMIIRALAGEPLPVYGQGINVRDWLHVDDHARALVTVIESGVDGETYNVGGSEERSNIQVVQAICDSLDERVGLLDNAEDRPGHDLRYAIDQAKIERELGWTRSLTFEQGLDATIAWYLDRRDWWEPLLAAKATDRRGLTQTDT
ncbi:UNVERIFIED_CONTAM: hypothetical protein GTU68_010462 [Idotea baltica]|nr:hypothetical protein [Idotea baltica]